MSFPSHALAGTNIVFLQQGLDLLDSVSDLEYTKKFPPAFSDGMGAHIRHVIDHYSCFFEGLVEGCIDYEARKRDSTLANDRAAASAALHDIIARLSRITEESRDQKIDVFMGRSAAIPERGRRRGHSSIDRELQFLSSHTVHHYALLAVILRLVGHEPAQGFGVSPSTIRHAEALR